jgi:glycosyltransferase involved in cell wall biosynthesis
VTQPYVVSVVQLPPPVTGLSAVNERVVRHLEEAGLLVRKIDLAPPRAWPGRLKPFGRLLKTLGAAADMLIARLRGARVLYMPCDGGSGLAFNIALTATARVLSYKLVTHHHSFAYLNAYSGLMKLFIEFSPRDTKHLMLCERMGSMLDDRYAASLAKRRHRTSVLPNAFMIDRAVSSDGPAATGPLTLGHLSNLTEEKGALRFIDIFARLRRQGVPVRAMLAGPARAASVEKAIADAARAFPEDFRWMGSVYGAEKERFYADVDVFVFPSFYKNEAQPLVLLEAMAHGAALVSTGRGCMGCDHKDSPGVILAEEDFEAEAIRWLTRFAADFDREAGKSAAQARFSVLKQEADAALAAFLASPSA